jgi:hypothetical protein
MAENKNKNKSKFQQESETIESSANTALAIFAPAGAGLPAGLKRRNMPTMITPGNVPVGAVISGEIVDIVDSPVSTIKGKLLHLRHESGQEYTFPCTGVIRNALAPGKKDDEADAALRKEIGKKFYAQRLADKPNTKYKKTMYMFDVYTSDK